MTQIALKKKGGILALIFLIFFFTSGNVSSGKNSAVESPASELGLLIKKNVAGWHVPSKKRVVRGERIFSSVLVNSFYKARKYQPAWSEPGRLTQIDKLITAIEEAYSDGLTPDYYHLEPIRSLAARTKKYVSDTMLMADLDILLTDAFLTLGCHLSAGCVNPVTIDAEWYAKRGNVDVSTVLEQALRKKQIREALIGLRPVQDSYKKLKQTLAQHRELSLGGEWPNVSSGPSLKKGTKSARVGELRRRLAASGDLDSGKNGQGELFDDSLEKAVTLFQKRHGLNPDGVVGPATRGALNVSLNQRIRQMELNLERLRWILGNPEPRSIVINIANYELHVMENGKPVLSMKVIVGKPFQQTPVFTAKMTYLVLNPSWNVPDSIAREEILSKIKKAPHYLAEQKMKVIREREFREYEIDPETINWSGITAGTLPYTFRQEPGPLNPLGQVKFMFPNRFSVYLHDTPSRRLFSEHVRTFSHGCTRIEKPVELAEYLLRDAPGWSREKILAAIEEGSEQKILVPRPLNVHFLYLTAWVDEEGTLQFRPDIYKRDPVLDKALRRKP
jgi:murein L,D-transpeptidase YcbB/YkuD